MALATLLAGLGIVAQIIGAWSLVRGARLTAVKLAAFPPAATYDSLAANLAAVTVELAEQYALRLKGFAALLVGSALQLAALLG